ncbi:MAG: uroporphyrinogen-III synthase, partial [Bacteroidota bacterium]|nr:uroporphyrinogen-III synthase [Bacteroidota bacterium]
FFCITDTVDNYLQNYIQYRKLKIFYCKLTFDDLVDVILKHKDEKFLIPCAKDARKENFKKLDATGIDYTKVVMYESTPKKNMNKEVDISKFDMIVFFSPIGVRSFLQNFPTTTSDDICFGAFGRGTIGALNRVKIKVSVTAPTIKNHSMVMALDNYLSDLQQQKE